ncbi:MAG: LuxR C-terminal-related transcriptional regulator [Sphingomonas sp.]
MRPPTTDILEIVGALHEGVADDSSWDAALALVSDALGQSGLLLGTMFSRGNFDLSGHRIDPAAVALLSGPLANPDDNPWVAAAPRLPLRRPVTVSDIGGQELLSRSRVWECFYTAFAYEMPDQTIGAVLERQPEQTDIIMLARRSRPFSASDTAVFRRLLVHLARSFRVRRQLQQMRAHSDDLTAALDKLERGVIITGPEGQIRFANRAADRLLTAGDGIDATRGRVRATRTRPAEKLRSMIYRTARTGIGKDVVAGDAVSISRSNDVNPIAVVAEPLAPGHNERLGQGRRAGTILFVGDSCPGTSPSVKRIASIYDLTVAEADIAAHIVMGASVASAAEARGITENTAKTHLKSIYEKIGVNRQSQLVRRVMTDIGGLLVEETGD